MAVKVLLGPSGPNQWDAANYVRQQMEDVPGYLISDNAISAYVQPTNEEFSRFLPLDWILGDPQGMTSPLVTVLNQQRYVCSAANGFPIPPNMVKGVSYLSTYFGTLTAQNEIALQQFLASTAAGAASLFQVVADSPTQRVIRDLGLDEIARYNRGFYQVVQDGLTGLPALDLYPVPQVSGMPIVVRYTTAHQFTYDVPSTTYTFPTIPPAKNWLWAKLLLLQVLEEEQDRLIKAKQMKAGLVEISTDARQAEQRLNRLRDEVNGSLGMHTGAGFVTN